MATCESPAPIKAEGLKPQHGLEIWTSKVGGSNVEKSQLVRVLEEQLPRQHRQEGVGPGLCGRSRGGRTGQVGRDLWLWGAEQGWLGPEARRGDSVGCVLWVLLGCLTRLPGKATIVSHRRRWSAGPSPLPPSSTQYATGWSSAGLMHSLWTPQMHFAGPLLHFCSVPIHAALVLSNPPMFTLHFEDNGNLLQSFTSLLLGCSWAAVFSALFCFFLCLAPPVLEAAGFATVLFFPYFV